LAGKPKSHPIHLAAAAYFQTEVLMDQSTIAIFILGAIVIGVGGQAWVSWLDHQRRMKALDVIKAAMDAGREPPAVVYEQIEGNAYVNMGLSKRPWAEAITFGALGIGFGIAFALDPPANDRFLVIAIVMIAVSIGCFALAIFRPGQQRDDKR